jgi:hypothetical protein
VSDDDVLVTADVGPYGEVVALWSTAEGRAALESRKGRPGGPLFPSSHPPRPVAVRLTRHFPRRDAVVGIRELGLAHCHVQPLPDDRFVIAGARCRWRPDGVEPNAQVVDSAGDVVMTAVLGDGIGWLATTPGGQTWVGYFDEGVYGNLGWGGPDREPIGAPGLVRFDERLERAWDYPFDTGLGSISDCYALNVAGETVWACYYTDFPIVRIADGRVTGWTNSESGVSAVITDGVRCALVGGYGEDRDRVLVGALTEDGRFAVRARKRLSLPGGAPLPPRLGMCGRGDVLHVVSGTTHYRLDLDQLAR